MKASHQCIEKPAAPSAPSAAQGSVKHQPATPLPWGITGFRSMDGHAFGSDSCKLVGRTVQLENGASKANAAYIAHAANAYPKLVEALRDAATCLEAHAGKSNSVRAALALLRELGEGS